MNLYTVTNNGRIFAQHVEAKSETDALDIVRERAYKRLRKDYDDLLVIMRYMACYDNAVAVRE